MFRQAKLSLVTMVTDCMFLQTAQSQLVTDLQRSADHSNRDQDMWMFLDSIIFTATCAFDLVNWFSGVLRDGVEFGT